MRARSSTEIVVMSVCAVAAIGLAVAGVAQVYKTAGGVAGGFCLGVIGVAVVAVAWARAFSTRSRARGELEQGEEHRRLTDEYRRLADMAITAQEHTDLKLGDVSARIDYLTDQMQSLSKILKEVE